MDEQSVKYAIQVPFLDGDWIYVTNGSLDNISAVLYNSRNEAEEAAAIWKNYRIVEYHENQNRTV